MSTLRTALTGIFWVLVMLMCVGGVVVGISEVMPPREQRVNPNEAAFRAACAAVNGNAVWNGRHWECLK